MENRNEIAKLITSKLLANRKQLKQQFQESKDKIGYFYIDDLLPVELVDKIHQVFPLAKDSILKKSLKEHKYVAYQMDKYETHLEEVIYAFQDKEVVRLIAEICDIDDVFPDKNLYAGGLSLMEKGNFLNPHLDNSHDKDRNAWRVLNLLFYVTPNWTYENGGNLELWPNGLKEKQVTVVSEFNRLAVMATHQNSLHSVSKVNSESARKCVSNYYYSNKSLLVDDEFHVTSFRGRSDEKLKDILFRIDSKLRMGILKIFKKGVRENPHRYKK